jgi:hypothetical protein
MTTELLEFDKYAAKFSKAGWELNCFFYHKDGVTYYEYVVENFEGGAIINQYCLPHLGLQSFLTEEFMEQTLISSQKQCLDVMWDMIQ